MRLQPLYDLQQEINRLFVAGSKFAKADPRLNKHITVFTKLGEKAPVFKKIATDLEDLVSSDSSQSSGKLTAISTLLYSVLYTQGDALEEGVERTELNPAFDSDEIYTENTYLQLKPVIQALTVSNSGRLEIIEDALKRGIFKDFRTWQYLDDALGDKYGELADYVAETVIPSVGKIILPFIQKNFDYTDKSDQVRRLKVLDILEDESLQEKIDKIFAENLPNLQAAAIFILARDPANEPFIIKLADDKNKAVRDAAYQVLVFYNTETALEKIKDVYLKGKSSDILIAAISTSTLPFFFSEIYAGFRKTWDAFFDLPKEASDKEVVKTFDLFRENLYLFTNKDRAETYEELEYLLLDKKANELLKSKKNVLGYSLENLSSTVIRILSSLDVTKRLAFYEKVIPLISEKGWSKGLFAQYYREKVQIGTDKETLYQQFFNFYTKGLIDINDLYRLVYHEENETPDLNILNDKWVKYLYQELGRPKKWNYDLRYPIALLDAYSPAPDKDFDDLMIYFVKTFEFNEADFAMRQLFRRQIKGRFGLIYESFKRYQYKKGYYTYSYLAEEDFWQQFPKEYVMKFRELYQKQQFELFNQIADAIEFSQR